MLLVYTGACAGFLYLIFGHKFPQIDDCDKKPNFKQLVILNDCNNKKIGVAGDFYSYIPFKKIPKNVINCLIATEDMHFWSHMGINIPSMLFALYENMLSMKVVRGGSTITQQLAKNLIINKNPDLTQKKTYRKISEILVALRIERTFGKEEILEFYLNRVYFGRGAYGISAACKIYFNKDLSQLNFAESAFLVGLLKAPSMYSSDLEKARMRMIHVINRTRKAGLIDPDEEGELSIKIFKYKSKFKTGCFMSWVASQIPQNIKDSNRPLRIKTTLDIKLQENLVNLIDPIKLKSRADFSEIAFIGCDLDGATRVMVGGMSDNGHGLNRVVQSFRQAGSLFKIYTYLYAFLRGMSPDDTIEDSSPMIGEWQPSNYMHNECGFVKLDRAFAESINGSAVRLAMGHGMRKIINLARIMGVTGKMANDLSVALGSGSISLCQLAQTLLILSNNGNQVSPYGILEIRDNDTNEILFEYSENSQSVKLITNSDAIDKTLQVMRYAVESEKGTARFAKSIYPVAGKTGTTQHDSDLWFGCITPFMVTCAWCGHDDNRPMEIDKSPGKVNPSVALCKAFLDKTFQSKGYSAEEFEREEDMDMVE